MTFHSPRWIESDTAFLKHSITILSHRLGHSQAVSLRVWSCSSSAHQYQPRLMSFVSVPIVLLGKCRIQATLENLIPPSQVFDCGTAREGWTSELNRPICVCIYFLPPFLPSFLFSFLVYCFICLLLKRDKRAWYNFKQV